MGKKKSIKKKVKDFSNRKTKEYLDSAVTAMEKVGKSDKADLKNAALVIPKMFRGFVIGQANRLINTKEERKAGGIDIPGFKKGGAVKSNVGKKMKKMKHGGMVIVDRQYLKGK